MHNIVLLLAVIAISSSICLYTCHGHDVGGVAFLPTALARPRRCMQSRSGGTLAINDLRSTTSSTIDDLIHSIMDTQSSSLSKSDDVSTKHHLHLLSLPFPNVKENTTTTCTNNDIRQKETSSAQSLIDQCWTWKNMALGDGADHIVPRRQRQRRRGQRRRGRIEFIPRSVAIRQFQSLFVGMQIRIVGDDTGDLRVILKMPYNKDNSITKKKAQSAKNEVQDEVVIPIPPHSPYSSNTLEIEQFEALDKTFVIKECSVLSTCARFNIILVLHHQSICPPPMPINYSYKQRDLKVKQIAASVATAYILHQQLHSSSQKQLHQQSTRQRRNNDAVYQIANQFTHIEGAYSISSHLSVVASGLAPRPDRTFKTSTTEVEEVVFRPYSSHDSHILMQLKRAVEIISVQGSDGTIYEQDSFYADHASPSQRQRYKKKRTKGTKLLGSPSRGRIKTLLDAALRAGKLARNEHVVPEIIPLKLYCLEDDSLLPPSLELCVPAVKVR